MCWSDGYPSGSHLQHYHPFWPNCNSRPSVWLLSEAHRTPPQTRKSQDGALKARPPSASPGRSPKPRQVNDPPDLYEGCLPWGCKIWLAQRCSLLSTSASLATGFIVNCWLLCFAPHILGFTTFSPNPHPFFFCVLAPRLLFLPI
jgi:hypothetical protein